MKPTLCFALAALVLPLISNALFIPQPLTNAQFQHLHRLHGTTQRFKPLALESINNRTPSLGISSEVLNFDDIPTNGDLVSLSEKPYHGLIFSPHFLVANSSESVIPSDMKPLSPPNLALVLISDNEKPPTITVPVPISPRFSLRRLGIQPIIPDDLKTANVFAVCLTGYADGELVEGGCRLEQDLEGMEVIEVGEGGFVERAELEVFVLGRKVSFGVDDLVVEWETKEEFVRLEDDL